MRYAIYLFKNNEWNYLYYATSLRDASDYLRTRLQGLTTAERRGTSHVNLKQKFEHSSEYVHKNLVKIVRHATTANPITNTHITTEGNPITGRHTNLSPRHPLTFPTMS